jgi:hypothetical protein
MGYLRVTTVESQAKNIGTMKATSDIFAKIIFWSIRNGERKE